MGISLCASQCLPDVVTDVIGPDCVRQLLECLPPKDLLTSTSRVCRAWNLFSRDAVEKGCRQMASNFTPEEQFVIDGLGLDVQALSRPFVKVGYSFEQIHTKIAELLASFLADVLKERIAGKISLAGLEQIAAAASWTSEEIESLRSFVYDNKIDTRELQRAIIDGGHVNVFADDFKLTEKMCQKIYIDALRTTKTMAYGERCGLPFTKDLAARQIEEEIALIIKPFLEWVTDPKRSAYLDLVYTMLFPHSMKKLNEHVERLYVVYPDFVDREPNFDSLSSDLTVTCAKAKTAPIALMSLTGIKTLTVSGNKLLWLPDFSNMKDLEELHVSAPCLTGREIRAFVGDVRRLVIDGAADILDQPI